MAIGVHHESAVIYAFPAKRFSKSARPAIEIEAELEPCVYDSCWYHEDAMKEEAAPTKPSFKPRLVD